MTSKEALNELIIEQQKLILDYRENDHKTADEIMMLFKTISKDLELLDKIKNQIDSILLEIEKKKFVAEMNGGCMYDYPLLKATLLGFKKELEDDKTASI